MLEEFFKAIKQGEHSKIEEMLGQDPGLVNAKNESGMSGVVIASYYGEPKIASLLVSRGAKLDVFEAAIVGDLHVTKKLVEQDKKLVNDYSNDGFTPLHLASFFGNLGVARFLIEQGADANARAKDQMKVTPLHSAAARNQVEISKLLISNHADVNAKQENDFTPLHAAAQSGNIELAQLLLEHGALESARLQDGRTPIDMTKDESREAGKKEDREAVAKILAKAR
jgi:ankyrin repeat protein